MNLAWMASTFIYYSQASLFFIIIYFSVLLETKPEPNSYILSSIIINHMTF